MYEENKPGFLRLYTLGFAYLVLTAGSPDEGKHIRRLPTSEAIPARRVGWAGLGLG
jgi:hypothetical protein